MIEVFLHCHMVSMLPTNQMMYTPNQWIYSTHFHDQSCKVTTTNTCNLNHKTEEVNSFVQNTFYVSTLLSICTGFKEGRNQTSTAGYHAHFDNRHTRHSNKEKNTYSKTVNSLKYNGNNQMFNWRHLNMLCEHNKSRLQQGQNFREEDRNDQSPDPGRCGIFCLKPVLKL